MANCADTPQVSALSACTPTNAKRTIDQRLDALQPRLSGFYVRLLLLAGVSWAVHATELVLFTFTRTLVAKNIGMGTYALEALGAAISLGTLVGGPLFGYVADWRGRRTALLLAMGLSLVGLALSAMARRDYHVIVARAVAGVGLGGELPAATVLVQELCPRSMRGRMVALLEAFTGLGGVVGVALAFGVAPQLGWRVMYLALCGCVLYTGVLRCGIPESPRWLASVGRVEEALAVVEKLERAHGQSPSYSNVQSEDVPTPMAPLSKPTCLGQPVHTLVLWTLWTAMAMSSYALGTYVPTLISLSGFNMYETWSTTALLHAVQVLGCMMAASVLETRGRKRSLACFATLASIVSVALSYAPWSRVVVVAGTCSVAALLAGSWSCVLAYTPEHYATSVRGRGVAYAFGFSRLGAIGGSLLYPHMFDVWVMSVPAITWVFAGLLAAVVVGIVLPYGYSPRDSDDSGGDSDDGSETDLESSVGPAEEELRLVASVSERKTLSRGGEVERELELEELPVEEVEPEASPSHTLALNVEEHED